MNTKPNTNMPDRIARALAEQVKQSKACNWADLDRAFTNVTQAAGCDIARRIVNEVMPDNDPNKQEVLDRIRNYWRELYGLDRTT